VARWVRVQHEKGLAWGLLEGEDLHLYTAAPYLGGTDSGLRVRFDPRLLAAPVEPRKILGVGTNYKAHAIEMGKPLPDEPLLFFKPPTAVIGPGTPIVRPNGFQRTDFEGELGVVIGKTARRVTAATALDYVFGYTIVNDVTVRDLQKKDGQFTRAKGFDSFCPVGPWIVTDVAPGDLRLVTRQNDTVRQDSRTSDLIFSIAQVIECASRVMTLEPGDLISTGTPSGVGPIAPGDRIEIEIEQIGTLHNPVVEET
jgi:2-keto-4-pentenoate hydratase/2-oxohepta-3-ene-1,7-dioic acid hydratase in catechol pathway